MFTIRKWNNNFYFNWLLEAWIGLLLVDILLWVQFTSTTFIQAYNCLCLDILCFDQDFVLYMIEIVPLRICPIARDCSRWMGVDFTDNKDETAIFGTLTFSTFSFITPCIFIWWSRASLWFYNHMNTFLIYHYKFQISKSYRSIFWLEILCFWPKS